MRILVCGDRNWHDRKAIKRELTRFAGQSVTIIEGEAPGADRLAAAVAQELGFSVERYPADWARFGRGAGPVRNRQMLNEGRPELVIAFHPDLSQSKGTMNMIRLARDSHIKVEHYHA